MKNKEEIKDLLFEGYTITWKDLSICDLRRYLPHRDNHARVYQVDCFKFTEIYKDIDQAVNKFLSLRKSKR